MADRTNEVPGDAGYNPEVFAKNQVIRKKTGVGSDRKEKMAKISKWFSSLKWWQLFLMLMASFAVLYPVYIKALLMILRWIKD